MGKGPLLELIDSSMISDTILRVAHRVAEIYPHVCTAEARQTRSEVSFQATPYTEMDATNPLDRACTGNHIFPTVTRISHYRQGGTGNAKAGCCVNLEKIQQ